MNAPKEHIAQWLRNRLPDDKKDATWGYLAGEFPWYPMVHWLRAAENPNDRTLLQKAALFAPDLLQLHSWLHSHSLGFQPTEPTSFTPANPTMLTSDDTQNRELEKLIGEIDNQFIIDKNEPDKPELMNEDTPVEKENLPITDSEQATTLPGLANLKNFENQPLGTLPIEPYHAIDYFASQGIKVDKKLPGLEETKLDKQVKSFTDWLKTMKKLKYQPATEYADPLVESQAKKSLDQRDIVTEAMAEVWLKQGNFSEAARVYARLMLLHPEKTPYFAARLQEINQKQ